MVIHVRDVILDHAPDRHGTAPVVRAAALERLLGQLSQHASELAATYLKEGERILQRLLVRKQPIHIGRLISVQERRFVNQFSALGNLGTVDPELTSDT